MRGLQDFFARGREFRWLYLGNNKITTDGFETLVRCLQGSRIENVDLNSNRITKEGAIDVLPLLKDTRVRYVNFKHNIIEGSEKAKLSAEYKRRGVDIET